MPKKQNQITMRKVYTVILSLVSRLPNHHSSNGKDRQKHPTLLTLIRRINIVHDVTKVEQQELFGIDEGRPLPDVTPERAKPLAVVEGVQNRFLQTTAAVRAINHVCHARSESPVVERQRIPGRPPSEQELEVVQEVRTSCPIPLRAILLQRPAELPHKRIRSRTHH